jgi:polyphosphate kinase
MVSPSTLRLGLEELIEREIANKQAGRPAYVMLKTNALVDGRIVRLLYRASCAGVKVDLLIRGICCLRPGVPGVSENIRVTSIVGRFLEHTRLYYFRNGGAETVLLGSADLMPRNLDRRVEILFPVEDSALLDRMKGEILDCYLADNTKARRMQADGSYVRVRPGKHEAALNAQDALIPREARARKTLKTA